MTWPRITIVTPSLNQGQFLDATIQSVLQQNYPALEYVIIDGGSADGSVDIIRRYAERLAFWVSEPDRGQSHAINKGFERATGELFAWLNSDDTYLPEALERVAAAFRANPAALVAAGVVTVDERPGRRVPDQVTLHDGLTFEKLIELGKHALPYHQPGLFFPAAVWRSLHGLDESLRYTMDYDLLCRALRVCPVTYIPDVVARFRLHGESKTGLHWLAMVDEQIAVARKYRAQVGLNDEESLREYVVDGLVNYFYTETLRGHTVNAADMLRRALRKDVALTASALVRQLAAGTVRRLRP